MFELEPGPLARLEQDQMRPFPTLRSFTGIVADAIGDFPALDARLAGAASATTENPPVDLDAVYGSTIGGASAEVSAQIDTAPVSPAAQFVDNGDNADGIRRDSLRYLPGPDAPINPTLEDPPQPPGGVTGGDYAQDPVYGHVYRPNP